MSRTARPALAALSVAVAVLAGCASTVSGHGTAVVTDSSGKPSTSSAAPSPAGQPRASFGSCASLFDPSTLGVPDSRRNLLSFRCAKIKVPADYAQPSGPTLTLQLVKIHDSRNTTGKALLVNPGGPGGSGVDLAVGLSLSTELSDTVLEHYDLVGFDPRGVALSSPVKCLSDKQKDSYFAASPNVLTSAGFADAKAEAKMFADACAANYGSKLADLSTVQTAKDMDRIRQALGQAKLDYLGFSYGTELGSIYVHLFPGNVGRTVLDGAVDPYTDPIASFADQLQGFELAFDQFATWCRTASGCSALGDPRQAVYSIVAKANAAPISAPGDSRSVTSALALTGVLQSLYSRGDWPKLGQALLDARSGNAKRLLGLADEYNQRNPDGSYSNIADANTAINCNDAPPGPTDDTVRTTALKWQQAYPMFGLWSAASLFSCQSWQPERTPLPVPSAPTAPTVLVIGNLHDPATPYQGAKDLTKALGHAVLLSWNGQGHTSYLEGSTCIDSDVTAYLVDGTLPAAGTLCQ